MKLAFISLFLLFSFLSFTQKGFDISTVEEEILSLSKQLRQPITDQEKINFSQQIMTKLKTVSVTKEGFEYTFPKVKTIGFINSPDKLVRIINWNIEKSDNSNQYFGLVVRFDDRKKDYILYELKDSGDPYEMIPDDYIDGSQWYGALYYKIIPVIKNNKTIYTVLGYDANNKTSHIKLIDAISFTGAKIKFGNPMFQNKKELKKRIVFEHSKKSVMSLKFDLERNQIVFDHLSPENPIMAEFREFYVPDMSYDSYTFNSGTGKWELKEDIIAINKETEKQQVLKVYDLNKKGEMVTTAQKGGWIDPSDKNAPAGSNIHTPALPDEAPKSNSKQINTPTKTIDQYQFPKTKKNSKIQSNYETILKGKTSKKKK